MFMSDEKLVWSDHPSFIETLPAWIFSLLCIVIIEGTFHHWHPILINVAGLINNPQVTRLMESEMLMRSVVALIMVGHPLLKMIGCHYTNYAITSQRIIIGKGVLNRRYEEIELFRVRDVSIKRSFFQRLTGLGTVFVISRDMTQPECRLRHVGKPFKVVDILRKGVYAAKEARGLREMEVT